MSLLNDIDEKEILIYAKELGYNIHNKQFPKCYSNLESDLATIEINCGDESFYICWTISINGKNIFSRHPTHNNYCCSTVLNTLKNENKYGFCRMFKYRWDLNKQSIKKYLKNQIIKYKKNDIKTKLQQLEKDFK